MKQKIVSFIQEVGAEMKKVSWPTTKQLQESTAVTLITCLILTVFVYGIDILFTKLFSIIF